MCLPAHLPHTEAEHLYVIPAFLHLNTRKMAFTDFLTLSKVEGWHKCFPDCELQKSLGFSVTVVVFSFEEQQMCQCDRNLLSERAEKINKEKTVV